MGLNLFRKGVDVKQTLRRVLTGKMVLILLGVICLYSLIGFFIAPWGIGWYAPKIAVGQFHWSLDMGKVRINPFLLTVEVNDVHIGTSEEPLAEFKKLSIDFEITRLGKGAATFRHIHLENPILHLTVHPDGSTNLEKAIPTSSAADSSDTPPFRMVIKHAQISGGTILVTDKRQSRPARVTLQELGMNVTDISTLPDHSGKYALSARTPEGETFACQGEIALTPFSTHGKLSFGDIQMTTLWQFMKDSLDLESVTGKLDIATDYHLNTSAQLQLEGFQLAVLDLSLKRPRSDKAFFELKKLDVDQASFNLKEKQLRIGKLLIAGGAVNLLIDAAGHIDIAEIARKAPQKKTAEEKPITPKSASAKSATPSWSAIADRAEIQDIAFGLDDFSRILPVSFRIASIGMGFAAKFHTGTTDSTVLVEDFSSELKEASIQRSGDTRPVFETHRLTIDGGMLDLKARTVAVSRIALQGGGIDILRDATGQINWQRMFASNKAATEETSATKPEPAWNYQIKSMEVDGFESNLSDISTVADTPILNIQSFSCRLTDVDGRSPMNFEAGFSLKQGGTVAAHGKADPSIPSVDADLKLDALSLKPIQPYLQPYTVLTLQSADVSLQGNIRYGMKTADAKLSYTGSARLDNLNLTETGNPKTLIGCDSLSIPKCTLSLQPDMLNIDEIQISKPTGEIIIAEDRTLNLSRMFKPQADQADNTPQPKRDSEKKSKDFPIRIGKIAIQKGDVIFADLSLQPQFITRIADLKGKLSDLSSSGDSPSPIRLDGSVDQYGLARVYGKINVFHPALSTDLSLIFKNVEMTKLTPYSGKFAGRRITSGKLSLDLKYRIQNQKLVGDNQIIVDNLTLGEHIDSPSAVNLPLDLAVALLTDARGRIDIGLPVNGDLNDPEFSYGHLLWKALVNSLTQIVTSPFRALSSLFGGGSGQQDIVVFDPGKAELLPPEKEKLLHLADMLKNRPQLKLTIQGRFNPESDGTAIKTRIVRLSIASLTGTTAGRLDFTNPQTQEAMEKLFTEKAGAPAFDELKRSVTDRTQNKADIYRILSETLYKKLVEMEPAPNEKLSGLAEERGREIIQELETVGGIPSDRLAVKNAEPQTSGPPSAVFSLNARNPTES